MKKALGLALSLALLLCACGAQPASSSASSFASSASAPSAASSSGDASGSSAAAGAPSSSSESIPLTTRLTIPEGYTLARIGMTLADMGICTTEEFIEAAQTGDYSGFPLVAAQAENANRCFKLEGYLFPDTYEIYTNTTPDAIIRAMLQNLERRIDDALRSQIEASGFTVDEILTLASIIEKEGRGGEELAMISSVLHNRLAAGQRLECDVTKTYVEGAIKPFITGDLDRYSEYYNTYKCPALPAGAICNPGRAAITAALNPADSPYYFFLTDKDNNYYFAETFEEHQENIAKYMNK